MLLPHGRVFEEGPEKRGLVCDEQTVQFSALFTQRWNCYLLATGATVVPETDPVVLIRIITMYFYSGNSSDIKMS